MQSQRRAAPGTARARALRWLGAHAFCLAALAGGAFLRWTAVRGYPGVLWFTGDSYFYLGRALRPHPSPSKTIGYSFLLNLMEPAAQPHRRGGRPAPHGARRRGDDLPAAAAGGAARLGRPLVALPVLYDAYQIELEHLLMSEALFTFLIAAGVTLLLWRIRTGPPWWLALPAGLLLGYAVLVRSAGAPLIPVILVCLLLRRRGLRAAAAFGAAAAVPIVSYMAWFHSVHGGYGLTCSDGLYLWGRTAVFADCAKIRPPMHEDGLCLTPELKRQGHAPGHLIWRSEAPPRVIYESTVGPQADKALRDFAIRAMLAQPGDYLRTVADGVGKAFSPERFPYPTAATEALYHFPPTRRSSRGQELGRRPLGPAGRHDLRADGDAQPGRPAARRHDGRLPATRVPARPGARRDLRGGRGRDAPGAPAAPHRAARLGRGGDAAGVPDRLGGLRLPLRAARHAVRLPGRRPAPGGARRGGQPPAGKPSRTPRWLGSGHRAVTALVRV
ncbi:hypothetical protein [Actinomadura keratinilytica]|uniref:hypothetical protein n=1 Tax=Actinomadura keratinilytica TaxID=547461 RepID=UPI00361E0ABB